MGKLAPVFIFLFVSKICIGQITDLRLGSDVWPPFTNNVGETAFASEIVKEALNRNKVAVMERTMDFSMVIKAIENGGLDGSPALWKSPAREDSMIFSEPYLHNQLILVSMRKDSLPVNDLEAIAGKRLAIVRGYAYGAGVDSLKNVQLVYSKSDQENLLKLLKGQADYMLVDELLIRYLVDAQPGKFEETLSVSESPVIIESLHFAIRKDLEGGQELIDGFNEATKAMLADGSYNRILRMNWITADLDGDGKLELISHGTGGGSPENGYKVHMNDSSNYPTASGNTYYINGKVYTSWEDVPADFKRGPGSKEDVETFNFLRFNF